MKRWSFKDIPNVDATSLGSFFSPDVSKSSSAPRVLTQSCTPFLFWYSNYRHWWHAHFENQYIDGLVGAIIIHEPPETDPFLHAYDEERTIVISDWYHQPTGPLLAHYLSPDSDGMEPMPNNGLINGKHTFNCANVIPADLKCEKGERTVFHFLPNRRYRLRIINTGYDSNSNTFMSIARLDSGEN